MKKGIEVLGAEFVLDEFHIQKYIRKLARVAGGSTEEGRKQRENCRNGSRRETGKNWRNGQQR